MGLVAVTSESVTYEVAFMKVLPDSVDDLIAVRLVRALAVVTHEDWLKGIDNVFANENWILEVMECAMSTFRR